jgi:hypothetical protein
MTLFPKRRGRGNQSAAIFEVGVTPGAAPESFRGGVTLG